MILNQSYEAQRDLLIGMAYRRSNTLVAQRTYAYDAAGRPTERNTARQGTTRHDTFTHNDRSELTAATLGADTYAYDYDNIGNRTAAVENSSGVASHTEYQSNNLNQYTEINDFTPEYDLDGNQTRIKTSTGIWLATYNAINRPVRFESADGTTVITADYDYMGRRVFKRVEQNGSTTDHLRFLYRGYLQISALDLTRPTLNPMWYITWDATQPAATRPLAIQKDRTWYTYGWDLTKNICEVYGQAGYVRTAYTYTPYGAVTADGDVQQPIQWSSEYNDTELGLVYYNYRHYNPVDGRWIRRDPLGEGVSVALMVYVNNNPTLYSDEMGHRVTTDVDADLCIIYVKHDIVIYSSLSDPVDKNKLSSIRNSIVNSIKSNWNGFKKGCCSVVFEPNVTIKDETPSFLYRWINRKSFIEMSSKDGFVSYVSNGKNGTWWANANPWVYAHEAGHLAGLRDDYVSITETNPETGKVSRKTIPNVGHEGHIMAEFLGKVQQHEIDSVLKNVKCVCNKK